MKKKTLIFISLAFIIIYLLVNFYRANDCYKYRINIQLEDTSSKDMDLITASEVKDELSQIEEVKEVVIFSKANNCSVYCKLFPFVLNKALVADRIEKRLNRALLNTEGSAKVDFDDNYNTKFHSFLVVSTNTVNYKVLKKYCDEVLDELLGANVSSKILNIGEQKRTAYIYFKNNDLVKYDINLEDIKDIVQKNNILNSATTKTNPSNSYNISTNSALKSIEDIENITLFYKNKNFSTRFKDVFKIEEGINEPPEALAFFDNKKAQVFAISKKTFYPSFLFQYKLKKLTKRLSKKYPKYIYLNLLNTSSLEAVEIYFKNRTSIYNTLKEYQKIYDNLKDIKNTIYLVGLDSPKISTKEAFFEKEKNKMVILTNKFNAAKVKDHLDSKGINYLKSTDKKIEFEDINLAELYKKLEEYKNEYSEYIIPLTDKTIEIAYLMDNYSLRDYMSEKEEILNTIKAAYKGLDIGYYYDNSTKIPIVIQNADNLERLYYYSKNYKALIYLGSVAKSELKEDFSSIVRKNEKYYAKIIIK